MNRIVKFLWPGIPDDPSSVGDEVRVRQFVLVAGASATISGANIINTLLTAFVVWNVLPATLILDLERY